MVSSSYLAEIGNGQRETRTVIGRVHIRESFEHKTSEQTACNYRLIEVPAGSYDVVLDGRGYWAFVSFPGTIVDEHFVNRLFGSTSLAEKRDIGKPATAYWQMYGYSVAEKFATDADWELAEDWQVTMTSTTYGNGRQGKRYALQQQGA